MSSIETSTGCNHNNENDCDKSTGCTWLNNKCQPAVCSQANCAKPGNKSQVNNLEASSQENNIPGNANVCGKASCSTSLVQGSSPSPSPPESSKIDCSKQGSLSAGEGTLAFLKGLVGIVGFGFAVPDPITSGDDGKDPLESAKMDMQSVNSMGQIMSMQYQIQIDDKLYQVMETNEKITQDSIILNNLALQAGITQNKISILVANIILFMIIVFLLFKK
jgi:hypothetical protein